MLKRPITYKDFNDEEVTDICYFHLSETDLIDMEVEHEGGLKAMLEKLIEKADRKGTVSFFKTLVLSAYGVKSDDGKSFVKNDELRLAFSQTGAYNKLFMELATDDKAAADFLKGIIPKSMSEDLEKALQQQKTAEALGTHGNG